MTHTDTSLRDYDLAYGAYLFFGLVILLVAVISIIPTDSGMAGGMGFLLLIPLSLMGFVMLLVGLWKTVGLGRQPMLWVLALVAVLFLVEAVTEWGSAAFYNALTVFACLVTISLPLYWFVFARKRFQPPPV